MRSKIVALTEGLSHACPPIDDGRELLPHVAKPQEFKLQDRVTAASALEKLVPARYGPSFSDSAVHDKSFWCCASASGKNSESSHARLHCACTPLAA
jgi:hypothetical protein